MCSGCRAAARTPSDRVCGRSCGVAAVAEAGLMSDENLTGAEGVTVRAARRRWAIHFPAVVCASSPC